LHNDQNRQQSARASSQGGGPGCDIDRTAKIDASGMQRGNKTKTESDEQHDSRGKTEYRPIKSHRIIEFAHRAAGDVAALRTGRDQRRCNPQGEKKSADRSENRKDNRLRDLLSNKLPAAGAEGGA